MLKIIQLGQSKILETKAEEVTDVLSVETQNLIDEMLKVVNSRPESTAGLSAPQVDISLQIAICRRIDLEDDSDEDPNWEIMINPKITKTSKSTTTFWEGCLSINEGELFGKVERPEKVTVEYLNRKGEKRKLEAEDYFSHVVQHEVDHLNGILFLKYVKDPTKLYTSEELDRMRE